MRAPHRLPPSLTVAVAGLMAFAACIAGASESALTGVQIEALRGLSERGEAIALRIEDTWPNACVPVLQRVEVRGREIRVYAREPSDAGRCMAQSNRYRIDTRALRGQGATLEEPGIQRVHYIVESALGEQLRGFELLQPGGGAGALPEAGLWWPDPAQPSPSAGPGIGLALERQGNQLGLQLFGYDADGRPEWTMANGSVEAGLARLPLTRFAGGAGPQAAYRPPQEGVLIGRLLLEPVTPSRAVLWLAYDEIDGGLALREVPIVRFALAGSAAAHWSGRWLLALPEAGDGFGRTLELKFGPALTRPGGFLLLDDETGAELDCEFPGREWVEIPAFCRLRLPEAGVDVMIDRPALQSLQGVDASGRDVRLFHLHP